MKTTILALAAVLLPVMASAQEIKPIDVKTGLWETTVTNEVSGMPAMTMPQIPPDKLAQLPPEQQARIQAMMKGGSGGPRTTTAKSCLTREMLDKGLSFQKDNSCTYKLTNSSSSKQEIHMECSRGNMKSSGDLLLDRIDSEHVKGNANIKSTGSSSISMKMSFDSKFVSSDCGDVKPATAK